MRIFILEYNSSRIAKFKQELVGHTVDYAESIEEGTSLVFNHQYDLLFLDSDGYKLAEWIASFTKNKKTPCVVHSCNPVGADNIVRVLPHAMKMPFPSLDIALVVLKIGFFEKLIQEKNCANDEM